VFPTVWTGRNRDDPTWAEGVSQVLCFSIVEVCIQITTVARSDIQNQHLTMLAILLQLGTHDKRGRRLFLAFLCCTPYLGNHLYAFLHGIRIPAGPFVCIAMVSAYQGSQLYTFSDGIRLPGDHCYIYVMSVKQGSHPYTFVCGIPYLGNHVCAF
jgi:hypothetical protein